MKYTGNYKEMSFLSKLLFIMYTCISLSFAIGSFYLVLWGKVTRYTNIFWFLFGTIALIVCFFMVKLYLKYKIVIDDDIITVYGLGRTKTIDIRLWLKFCGLPKSDIIIFFPEKGMKRAFFIYWFKNKKEFIGYLAERFNYYYAFPNERKKYTKKGDEHEKYS